jgi:hypothetical protein
MSAGGLTKLIGLVDNLGVSAPAENPIRGFLVDHIGAHPTDIARVAAERFGCTRQAVHKHLQQLVREGKVAASGATRNKRYALAALQTWARPYAMGAGLAEDEVWRHDLAPLLAELPANVRDILHYGATEMLNNAIDHAGARQVTITLAQTAAETRLDIHDDGVGIFRKIAAAAGLADERHAVVELAKGKFTTDPARHSGEGVFFASRMFDRFELLSGNVAFQRAPAGGPPADHPDIHGTLVRMVIGHRSNTTTKAVFDRYASEPDYAFDRTQVPVQLMRYGDDQLISRSQARRLLARFDQFRQIELDFAGVATVGQAFADEIFRVYRHQHPEVAIEPLNTSPDVARMISRAKA